MNQLSQLSVSRGVNEPAAPSKQSDRLLDMLDSATATIAYNIGRLQEAVQRLAGPGGPLAVSTPPSSGAPGGTLGRIDDKLAELRIEADRLEHLAGRLEAIARTLNTVPAVERRPVHRRMK